MILIAYIKLLWRLIDNYNTNITSNITISGLALIMYLDKYYNNNIPLVNKLSVYLYIKKAYYGGITEVYKP